MKDYRVADIVSPFKMILNCGTAAGVEKGDIFLIYSLTKPIVDPEDGQILEAAEIIKGRGKIIHVQTKVCTIESIEHEKSPTKTIRKNQGLGGMYFGTTEEIIEEPATAPFDGAVIGDYARLLKKN